MTKNKLDLELSKLLSNKFSTIGFIKPLERNRFYFEDERIIESVSFGGSTRFGKYYMESRASRKLKIIEQYWEDLEERHTQKSSILFTIVADPFNENKERETALWLSRKENDESVILKGTNHLFAKFENLLFPFLEKQSDINFLNKKHNEPFDKKGWGTQWFHKLIVAKLAGNNQYNDILEYILEHFKRGIENTPLKEKRIEYGKWVESFQEVNNRLKNVEPLENPYLGNLDLRNKILQGNNL